MRIDDALRSDALVRNDWLKAVVPQIYRNKLRDRWLVLNDQNHRFFLHCERLCLLHQGFNALKR